MFSANDNEAVFLSYIIRGSTRVLRIFTSYSAGQLKDLFYDFTAIVSFSTDDDDVDFENSRLGMWKNSYIDKLDWQFHSGHTQTIDTGPSRDHTSGSGKV